MGSDIKELQPDRKNKLSKKYFCHDSKTKLVTKDLLERQVQKYWGRL